MPLQSETPYDEIATGLGKIANIPSLNAARFRFGMRWCIFAWVAECAVGPKREARKFWKTVYDVKNTAATLLRQLEGVRDHLGQVQKPGEEKWGLMFLFKAHSADHGVKIFNDEHSEVISESMTALSALTSALNEIAPLTSGRLRGTKAYPGLAELVFAIETEARLQGGKFTLNKRDHKGTILDALDWLRSYCLAQSELKWIAQRLPQPNRHPLSVYEAALHEARIEARKDAQMTRKLEA
jgi:hypothetical protein